MLDILHWLLQTQPPPFFALLDVQEAACMGSASDWVLLTEVPVGVWTAWGRRGSTILIHSPVPEGTALAPVEFIYSHSCCEWAPPVAVASPDRCHLLLVYLNPGSECVNSSSIKSSSLILKVPSVFCKHLDWYTVFFSIHLNKVSSCMNSAYFIFHLCHISNGIT